MNHSDFLKIQLSSSRFQEIGMVRVFPIKIKLITILPDQFFKYTSTCRFSVIFTRFLADIAGLSSPKS